MRKNGGQLRKQTLNGIAISIERSHASTYESSTFLPNVAQNPQISDLATVKPKHPKRAPSKLASMRSRINDLEAQVTELQAELVRLRFPMRFDRFRYRECCCPG